MEQSSWGRLLGALLAPARTFRAIVGRPTWALALVVLIAAGAIAGILVTQRIDYREMMRESLEDQGTEVTEEQFETIVSFQERFGWALVLAGALLVSPLGYLLTALILWVALRLVGGDFTYPVSLAVTLHALLPRAVAALLTIPVALAREEIGAEVARGGLLASNLAAFAPEDAAPTLVALLGSIDLFTLWSLALLTVGFAVASRLSRTAAAATVIGLWVVWVLGKVGLVALFAGMGK